MVLSQKIKTYKKKFLTAIFFDKSIMSGSWEKGVKSSTVTFPGNIFSSKHITFITRMVKFPTLLSSDHAQFHGEMNPTPKRGTFKHRHMELLVHWLKSITPCSLNTLQVIQSVSVFSLEGNQTVGWELWSIN